MLDLVVVLMLLQVLPVGAGFSVSSSAKFDNVSFGFYSKWFS